MVRSFRHGRWVLVVGVVVMLAGCDWAAVGFGPVNTNFNPSEPALTESSVGHLAVAWSASCACSGQRPLVAGGVVYAVDGYAGPPPFSLTLRALDATTGAQKWSTGFGAGFQGEVLMAVANGLVYLLRQSPNNFALPDELMAVDATTGATRWQVKPPAPATGREVFVWSTIVDGSLAFVATGPSDGSVGEISALDTSGQVVWSVPTAGGVFRGGLTVDPGRIVFIASSVFLSNPNGTVVPLLTGRSESSGEEQSQVVAQVKNHNSNIAIGFANGLVYGSQPSFPGSPGVGAFALHPDTGALVWFADNQESVIAPSTVLTRTSAGTITARDANTGAAQWQAADVGGAQAVAGSLVYSIAAPDTINVRRISDGTLVGTVRPAAGENVGALTPADGHIYDAATHHLYALAPS